MFRSAASLLSSLAQLGQQPTPAEKMAHYRPTKNPGIVLVGSHVQKTTQQLGQLLQEDRVVGIEIDVVPLRDRPDERNTILQETLDTVNQVFVQSKTPVI